MPVGLPRAAPPQAPPERVALLPPSAGMAVVRRPRHILRMKTGEHVLGERTWLMGILNATPDSFSDGGTHATVDEAVERGLQLWEAGADVVDVGGESTRPGAARVDPREESERVVPIVARLRQQSRGLISVDTTRAQTAEAALDAGADIINDISGLRFEPFMASLAARRRCGLVIMHSRGGFEDLHRDPVYHDVMGEIVSELATRVAHAESAGVDPSRMVLDPGIGFSKSAHHSLAVLRGLSELHQLALPILVGPSRKSFIGNVLGVGVHDRALGTAAAVTIAIMQGAHVVRVHDVGAMREAARLADAVMSESGERS